jgi:hypothetical protein
LGMRPSRTKATVSGFKTRTALAVAVRSVECFREMSSKT